MDELNHDFQALALEGRAMGEVRHRGEHLRGLRDIFYAGLLLRKCCHCKLVCSASSLILLSASL